MAADAQTEISEAEIAKSAAEKLAVLEARLRQLGQADGGLLGWRGFGVSGGTAHRVLGDQMLAVLADSASLARRDMEQACAFALTQGISLQVVATEELDNPEYAKNDANRCFHCKDELFATMKALGEQARL